MQLSPSIFKAYDIRGIVPSTLTEEVALGLGRAFGTVACAQGETTVAVGRDGRLSGPVLAEALMRGRTHSEVVGTPEPLKAHRSFPGNRPSTTLLLDALKPLTDSP